MALIKDLAPSNLLKEKRKFLFDTSYNPQFEYVRDFSRTEMTKYGKPKKVYFDHAVKMIEKYGITTPVQPPFCTQDEVIREVEKIRGALDLPPLPVHFSKRASSQVMISKKGLYFRYPIKFKLQGLRNKLNHELQTHILRRQNQLKQTWNLNSEEENPLEFRLTEEGLANLHSFVDREDPIIRKTYLNYFAAYQADHHSFSELYHQLRTIGASRRLAWNLTLKQKRGLTDTGKPGGFSKNHLYFEGIVKVQRWIYNPDNDPRDLYLGRISLSEIAQAKQLPSSPNIRFPTFYDDIDQYRKTIEHIGKANEFSSLPE